MIDPERHLEKKKKKLRLGMVLDLGKLKFTVRDAGSLGASEIIPARMLG
jgi:16S rRNA U1498 N3-methylase RsmE